MGHVHNENPQAPCPSQHENRLGPPPRPDSDDNPRAISEVSGDGFYPLHDLGSEETLSLTQGEHTPFSPLAIAVTVTELENQGQPVHHSDVDGSAEREPFLGPLDDQNSEPESQTRLENSPGGKLMTGLSSSPTVEHKDHILLQSLTLEEAATQKPTRPKVKPFWKVWMLEIACILLSFSTFILIVIVLSTFDQQSVPDWPFKVTLNTMLSFLVTLAKAAFMLPVSIAISRAQWSWFLQEKPLYDFHVLDQASRGTWGSLVLLWRIRCSHFIALGAILMVVSTLTSPVTQLAINYAVRDVMASGEANTFVVRTIVSPGDLVELATHRSASIITSGDSEDMTGFIRPVSPLGAFCSTGNCTFDRYESLGICMEMANISSQLHIQEFQDPGPLEMSLLGITNGSSTFFPGEKIWKASLPGGYDLVHQGKLAVHTDMLNGYHSFGFQNNGTLLRTRIASLVLIYTAPIIHNIPPDVSDLASLEGLAKYMATIPEMQHEALEVIFYLCVQSYETSFRKGVEATSIVGSLAKPLEQETHFFLDMNCTSLLYNETQRCESNQSRWNETIRLESPVKAPRGPNSSEGSFSANYRSMESMAKEMKWGLTGGVELWYHPRYFPDPEIRSDGADFVDHNIASVLFRSNNMINRTRRNTCMQNLYMNFATTLSSTLRAVNPRQYTHNAYNIIGKAWKEESYVYITWGWISFLAIELIIATGFLTLLIITEGSLNSSQVSSPENRLVFQDIKNSSLAILVALNKECFVAAGGGLQPMDELKKNARSLRVKLMGNQVVPQEGTAETQSRGDEQSEPSLKR